MPASNRNRAAGITPACGRRPWPPVRSRSLQPSCTTATPCLSLYPSIRPKVPRTSVGNHHVLCSSKAACQSNSGKQLVVRLLFFLNLVGLFSFFGLPLWCSAFLGSYPFGELFFSRGSRSGPFASKRIGSFSSPCLY